MPEARCGVVDVPRAGSILLVGLVGRLEDDDDVSNGREALWNVGAWVENHERVGIGVNVCVELGVVAAGRTVARNFVVEDTIYLIPAVVLIDFREDITDASLRTHTKHSH